jgi:hypothetical protein
VLMEMPVKELDVRVERGGEIWSLGGFGRLFVPRR